jgi:kinesin family member 6/9
MNPEPPLPSSVFFPSEKQNEVIEENKLLLKEKYEAAKERGAVVNDSKGKIQELKALIEQRRVQRSVAGLAEGGAAAPGAADPEEERIKQQIEREKARYKGAFEELKALKQEIDNIQILLEKSRKQLTKDFEGWLQMMQRAQGAPSLAAPRETWGAPSTGGADTRATPRSVPLERLSQSIDLSSVDQEVLQMAAPMLTGNPEADKDILRFYAARKSLMKTQK